MTGNGEFPRTTSRLDQEDGERRQERNKTPRQSLIRGISSEAFDEWHRERQFTKNIRTGTPYFNGPSSIKPPERHSPSSLLQCNRKTVYKQLNTPVEKEDPAGIFWIGSQFEEGIALPFLRDLVSDSDEYVTNSLWVNYTVETDVGEIHIKGETDPVVVDSDGKPLLITEIKTRKSVDSDGTPSRHHRAQAHAYMKGLSEKYDRNVIDAIILYGGRTNLNIQAHHIRFDPVFWRRTVINWAETHTSYRLDDELPPAEPEYEWECTFCPYKERCGRGELGFADVDAIGLVPGFIDYPERKLSEYLEAHEGMKMTPVLAHEYPELAEQYDVFDWQCEKCSAAFEWTECQPTDGELPLCPSCGKNKNGRLRGPTPQEQQRIVIDDQSEVAPQ